METTYRVLRIEEQMYGCEELPAGQPVLSPSAPVTVKVN